MCIRFVALTWLVALLLVTGGGCKKSEPATGAAPVPEPSGELLARAHWLGKKRIASETNASNFIGIWNLPESAKIEAQALDKLATAPWRLLLKTSETNVPSALLRPLLEDIVQNECYLEVRQSTNEPIELVFAVRSGAGRAALWEKNLATVAESLTGLKAASKSSKGWSLKKHHSPNLIELTQAGDWTVMGLAQEQNKLMDNILARLRSGRTFASGTNFWLEADLDASRAFSALSQRWSLSLPVERFAGTIIGDGENVNLRGRVRLRESMPALRESWALPTNLIHEPLVGFTAVRGFAPWLGRLKCWSNLNLGTPPDQAFFWALDGVPYQSYFAAPLTDASNRLYSCGEKLKQAANPWLAQHGMGSINSATNSGGFDWVGVPFMIPHVRSVQLAGRDFIYGGFFPINQTNPPPPTELLEEVFSRTNLICYDWEVTAARIQGWIDIGQLARIGLHRPQIPPASAGMQWLKQLQGRLGNCATVWTAESSNELAFIRKSNLGLTGIELHLLVDWLECPTFPAGFYSLTVADAAKRGGPVSTNAPGAR